MRGLVFLSGEAAQPLLVKVNAKWVHAAQQYVNSQVEFQLINQESLVEITLHDVMPVKIEVFKSSGQENTPALARRFRLRNESSSAFRLVFELLAEVSPFSGQEPGLRVEFVLLGKALEHLVQVAGQMVFPCQCKHAWEVINSLVGLHLVKAVDSNAVVAPV